MSTDISADSHGKFDEFLPKARSCSRRWSGKVHEGAPRVYSPSCRVDVFSETGLPVYGVLGSSRRASGGGIMAVGKGYPALGKRGKGGISVH